MVESSVCKEPVPSVKVSAAKRGLVELKTKNNTWIEQTSLRIGDCDYRLLTTESDNVLNIKFCKDVRILYCLKFRVTGNEYDLALCLGNVILSATHSDAEFQMCIQLVKNHLYRKGAFLINCQISKDDYSSKYMQRYSMNVFEFDELYEASSSVLWKKTANYRKMKSLLKVYLGKLTFTFDNFKPKIPTLHV